MHSVRVGTQIVGGIALSAFLPELRRIGLLMSAVEVMIFQSLFRPVIARVGKGVPAPFTESAQRDPIAIVFWKGLQARSIYGNCEVSVADGE